MTDDNYQNNDKLFSKTSETNNKLTKKMLENIGLLNNKICDTNYTIEKNTKCDENRLKTIIMPCIEIMLLLFFLLFKL